MSSIINWEAGAEGQKSEIIALSDYEKYLRCDHSSFSTRHVSFVIPVADATPAITNDEWKWKMYRPGQSRYWVSVKTKVNVLCTFTGIPFNIVGLKTHLRAASKAAFRNSG